MALTRIHRHDATPANPYARDPNQPIDEEYTKKIREYTTETFFNSPLTDYLPASKTVPTPKAVLGDVAGAPGKLPYAEDVYKYMRMLEKASPRVKVFSDRHNRRRPRDDRGGGRLGSQLSAKLEENRARLAKLADPRTINMDDAEADRLVAASFPIYYITGTIHSPETGSPTALMELAYRLAVDESPYIKSIRDGGYPDHSGRRSRRPRSHGRCLHWHLAHPNKNWPPLVYWGHYVAHDNNRDAMALSLKLTRNVLNTYLGWKAQVLHDLHESVPTSTTTRSAMDRTTPGSIRF